MPPDIEEQHAKVGSGIGEDAKQGVIADGRHYRVSVLVLDEREAHLAALGGVAYFVGRSNQTRDPCCQILWIDRNVGLGVDQQPVAAEHNHCFDAGPLSNGDREVANARHR